MLIVHNHLVFYSLDAGTNQIMIVAVIDGRRDIERALGTSHH